MSFIKTGASAIGKLFIVVALAGAFLVGLVGVVYLSLRGDEIKVPEVVGKDFSESEKELAQNGLKIKKRATRYSQEKPNTILEQSPKAGETAKTGQLILVVVSQVNPEGTEAPAVVEKDTEAETDDTTGGNPDKPKKTTNKNANVKKPAQVTRDGGSTKTDKAGNSNTSGTSSNTTKSNTSGSPTTSSNKPNPTSPSGKPTPVPAFSPKAGADKAPQSGETRTRRVPN